LDDPLSAVDAPTAKHLVKYALTGPLINTRTIILVTHALYLVAPYAKHIVVMKRGRISVQGSPDTVLNVINSDDALKSKIEVIPENDDDIVTADAVSSGTTLSFPSKSTSKSSSSETLTVLSSAGSSPSTAKPNTLVKVEEQAIGGVSFKVYRDYIMASGGLAFIVLYISSVVMILLSQFSFDFWLKTWSESTVSAVDIMEMKDSIISSYSSYAIVQGGSPTIISLIAPSNSSTHHSYGVFNSESENGALYFVTIYGLLGLLTITVGCLSSIISISGSFYASKNLHKRLIDRILGAPLRFFEVCVS
jgi:ABC-type multidrug transport system fused ATPase/permease subunit